MASNRLLSLLLVLALGACTGGSSTATPDAGGGGAGAGGNDHPLVAGTKVALSLSSVDGQQLKKLGGELADLKSLTTDQLLKQHEVKHVAALGYDPSTATGLDLIQASSMKLDAAEQAILKQKGFVISERQQFPHMLYAYDTIYAADLPVYVSADSILDAVHRSYDTMLEDVEQRVLIPELAALLDGMRTRLTAAAGSAQATSDADFFLAVAKSLLEGKLAAPIAGAKAADIKSFVDQATAAAGHQERAIFGFSRDIDFSQFTPRGHYTDSEELKLYFRAMMWLGRVDLRLIETQSDGTQVFRRSQLDTVVLLRSLLDAPLLARWKHIDDTVEAFVGKSDYMRLPEVDLLLSDLGVSDAAGLAKLSDQKIAQTLVDKGYGAQLICSQIMVNATPDGKSLPLDRSFALFGQRYAVDSHVFSNVVYDRVAGRMMPSPLDAAYAALGNDQAGKLLQPELMKYGYAPALEGMRVLVDAHGDSFWNMNLYNLWLSSLRALSPTSDTADPKSAGLPTVIGTEAWGRRMLSTQLGSWAQLRHDTILYVKQSYTSGTVCEFPAAYVDPYPAFYAALARFAEHGVALADVLVGAASPEVAGNVKLYFDHLRAAMVKLGDMATLQQQGKPFTAEQMAFINQIVRNNQDGVCGAPPSYSGWYADLIYDGAAAGKARTEFAPTIADVHTQPTDEGGSDVGRILHVGTGYARLLVVTVDTCTGAKAYAGVASSYYETITDHWKRLTDDEWQTTLQGSTPVPDVLWTQDFVTGAVPATK